MPGVTGTAIVDCVLQVGSSSLQERLVSAPQVPENTCITVSTLVRPQVLAVSVPLPVATYENHRSLPPEPHGRSRCHASERHGYDDGQQRADGQRRRERRAKVG